MKISLVNGDVMRIPLADKSVNMIVCSPPYWGLRSYSTGDKKSLELGSESLHDCGAWMASPPKIDDDLFVKILTTLGEQGISREVKLERLYDLAIGSGIVGRPCGECFICNLRAYAAEFWRILRDDGSLWLNLGDSYCSGMKGGEKSHDGDKSYTNKGGVDQPRFYPDYGNLKPKDLVGIPWRSALALQSDGWYLRSDIIWHKPNPMPESVTDRPTKSHEYLFLLSKSKRYYYDADAVREEGEGFGRGTDPSGNMFNRIGSNNKNAVHVDGCKGHTFAGGRNRRTVWNIATAPYSGAHFATYPPDLVEVCIKAGTSERGACPTCGAQWERVVEVSGGNIGRSWHNHENDEVDGQSKARLADGYTRSSTGWVPTCDCKVKYTHLEPGVGDHPDGGDWVIPTPVPAIVFDPFIGSGTTCLVAEQLGRRSIGLDLSLDYLGQARERTMIEALETWESGIKTDDEVDLGPLFEGIS